MNTLFFWNKIWKAITSGFDLLEANLQPVGLFSFTDTFHTVKNNGKLWPVSSNNLEYYFNIQRNIEVKTNTKIFPCIILVMSNQDANTLQTIFLGIYVKQNCQSKLKM